MAEAAVTTQVFWVCLPLVHLSFLQGACRDTDLPGENMGALLSSGLGIADGTPGHR